MCKLKKQPPQRKIYIKKIFKFKNDTESRNTKQKGTLTIFQNRFCILSRFNNSEVDSVQEGVQKEHLSNKQCKTVMEVSFIMKGKKCLSAYISVFNYL